MPYLLSVCIPTRNRPHALQKTVEEIQKQVVACQALDVVEILISDNTDNNEMKIDGSEFKDSKNVRYMSNNGNIGYARSVNKLILEAHGEYVWLLADDDIILESAVKSIVDCLNNRQEKVINYLTFYSGVIRNGVRDGNFYFKNCSQHYFVDGRAFLEKYWLNIIFISVNIFHKATVISHAEKYALFQNINDVYQHALMCISFIHKFGHVQIMPKTLLVDSHAEKIYTSYNSVKIPVLDYVKLLTQLKNLDIDKRCITEIKKDIDSSILSNGLRFVIRRIETDDEFDYSAEYLKVIKNEKLYFSSRVKAGFIYLLLKFNKILSKPIVKAICILRGRKNLYKNIRQENIDWYENLKKKEKIKVSY